MIGASKRGTVKQNRSAIAPARHDDIFSVSLEHDRVAPSRERVAFARKQKMILLFEIFRRQCENFVRDLDIHRPVISDRRTRRPARARASLKFAAAVFSSVARSTA